MRFHAPAGDVVTCSLDHPSLCASCLRMFEVKGAEDRDKGGEEADEMRDVRDLRSKARQPGGGSGLWGTYEYKGPLGEPAA